MAAREADEPEDIVPRLSVPLGFEVVISGLTAAGKPWTNVYGYQKATQLTGPDAITIGAQFLSTVVPNLAARLATDWFITKLNVQDTLIPRVVSVPTTIPVPVVGTDTGVGLPAQNAIVTSWYTGASGRARRGRTYHPGIPVALVNQDSIKPAQLAQEVNAANSLRSFAVTGMSIVKSVISHRLGLPFAVTSYIIDTLIDGASRREMGHGV